MKLSIKAFALAAGLSFGLLLFISVFWLMALGYANEETLLTMIYPAFTISPLGSVLGLIYGFIDGALLGALFAWLYNILARPISSEQENA